jgi:hypothetical protein
MRELEEKLRERDLELQQLRENLDENEAAICQVRGEFFLLSSCSVDTKERIID